ALTAWVQSARFEFEPFVCEDDRPERPTKPAVAAEDPAPAETPADTGTEPDTGQPPQAINEQPATPEEENAEEAPRAESTEWQKRLRELEQLFLNLESPLDDPARRELWRAMA